MSAGIRAGVVLCVIGLAACGGSGEKTAEAPGATTAAPGAAPPLPGESTVSGRVSFTGTAPAPRVIRMDADPLCMPEGGAARSDVILVGPKNELRNVFLYVKDGLGDRTFPAPKTPVVLDQDGCRYSPHVFGIQVGQPLEVVNSDKTAHNVHAVPKTNSEFNFMQHTQGKRDQRSFSAPEVMVPFRCDVHGWMNAYAGVVAHPFYAVSKEDGSFEIRGLPAGTYTIEAWHEQLGTQTKTVTVDGKTGAMADFAFASKS